MDKSKVVKEREECKECESCVASCPVFFQVADEGLAQAQLKVSKRVGGNDELDTDDPGCSKDDAEVCPANGIHIFEGGKKII